MPGTTVRLAAPDEPVASARSGATVAAIVRTPVSVVLERCNVDSDNLYAECLLKLTGTRSRVDPGSWANGAAVVRMIVKDRIGASHAASLAVGWLGSLSGESCDPPTSGALASEYRCRRSRVGETYVRSLAVAKEEGTVKNRFKGMKLTNEVRAKSGYIREVRTLSGLVSVVTESDALVPGREPPRRLAFSILVNDIPSGRGCEGERVPRECGRGLGRVPHRAFPRDRVRRRSLVPGIRVGLTRPAQTIRT